MVSSQTLDQDLSLSRPVEFTKVYALPAAELEFALFEWHGHGQSDEGRFDVSVGVLLAVLKMRVVLRDQAPEKAEHVALHIRVSVFVYGQTARSVLNEEDADTFTIFRQMLLDIACYVDHFFACFGPHLDRWHKEILSR